jgi:hypothetical protein
VGEDSQLLEERIPLEKPRIYQVIINDLPVLKEAIQRIYSTWE